MDYNRVKDLVGLEAVKYVKAGMTVGLGTGSTAQAFVAALINRYHNEDLPIHCVATSIATEKQARLGKLPLLDCTSAPLNIDLTFDGADWITANKLVLKGLGGASLREKIIAFSSKKLMLLIDDRKLCTNLDNKILPVEIIPFAYGTTIHHLQLIGCEGSIRISKDNTPFYTDNQNLIFDVVIPNSIDIVSFDNKICSIPGVVETGLFKNFSPTVIVGHQDGSIRTW